MHLRGSILLIVLIIPCQGFCSLSNGISLLEQGLNDSARTVIKKAWRNNPTNSRNRLWYALTLPDPQDALPMLKALCTDKAAPDSIRKQACAHIQNFESFQSHLAPKGPAAPLTLDTSADDTWPSSDTLRTDTLTFATPDLAPANPLSDTVRPTKHAAPKKKYTIQVGSFGAAVNAQKLKTSLQKEISSVYIVPFQSKGTTFYRVRIGHFDTKEEAVVLMKKKLGNRHLSLSVVEE